MGILSGLKILDFTTLLPGPFATMMLADMGADVLKIEAPNREDLTKFLPPMDGELSAAFSHINRSKRSLALDLKNDDAKEIIFKFVKEYDIVVEQFRPGVMERLGIGYEKLKEINPEVIYCSITGYGQTGPLKERAGHDINYLSIAGASSYSSRKSQPPVPAGIQVADIAGGSLPSIIGILAAVYHREKTGEGQYIDLSITDVVFAMNAMYGSGYLVGDIDPEAESLLLNGGQFYDYYETKDTRYFSVGSLEIPFQKRLCAVIGNPSLIQLSSSENHEDQQKFKQILTKSFKQKTFDEWLEILGEDFDGCIEPVLKFSESVQHPQIRARQLVVEVPKQDGGNQRQIALPIKFSTQPAEYKFAGVQTGTHSVEILKESGIDREIIKRLASLGAFGNQFNIGELLQNESTR